MSSRPRDNQRMRLYKAERRARSLCNEPIGDPRDSTEIRLQDVRKFVNNVLNRKYVQRHYTWSPIGVRLSPGRAYNWAHAYESASLIQLPRNGKWAFTKLVVLHEMAHIFYYRRLGRQGEGHGWEFAAIFLDLVRNVMGQEAADILKKEFRDHRVRYTEKRKRTLTPEQQEAARKRAAHARAAAAKRLELIKKFDQHIGIYSPLVSGGRWAIGGEDDWKIYSTKDPFKMTLRELQELEDRYRRKQQERKRHATSASYEDFWKPQVERYILDMAKPTSYSILTGIA